MPRMRLFWFESQSTFFATRLERSATSRVIATYSKRTSTMREAGPDQQSLQRDVHGP